MSDSDHPPRRLSAGGADKPAPTHPVDLTLLIVDDSCLYREGLAAMVRRVPGVSIVRTAQDLSSVQTALELGVPDVILLNLASYRSCDLLRGVRSASPGSRLIVLGASEAAEAEIVTCAEIGVAGYLMRAEPLEQLLRLLGSVAAEETLCSPRVTAVLLRRVSTLAAQRTPAAEVPVLTVREDQILRLLDLGLPNKEIAGRLGIEVRTVKNHVHSILSKLGVRGRGEAAAAVRRLRGSADGVAAATTGAGD